MIKGKKGFWLLAILFSLVVTTVVSLSGATEGKIVTEMNGTMGTMMTREHASEATLTGILAKSRQSLNTNTDGANNQAHHQLPDFIKVMDLGGAALILILLPLMVGTSVILVILWL